MLASTFLLFFFTYVHHSHALPQGAPTSVCPTMVPKHGGIAARNDISPYSVHARRQNGGSVVVTIASSLGIKFQGFILQARIPDDRKLLGTFQTDGGDVHTIDCDEPGDTLTHNNADLARDSVEVTWYPPADYEGPVVFNSTIAQDFSNFWVGVESPEITVDKRSIHDEVPVFRPTQKQSTTTPPNFQPEIAREAVSSSDPFYDGCSNSKFCFGAPENCIKTKSCQVAVAITTMGDKYDFELKGKSNPIWVGVGLSSDAKMGDDSVIECVRQGSQLKPYMSWTSGPPNGYAATRLNNPQLGIQLLNSSIVDDEIYCKVRRDARTSVKGQIFDLVNEKYHVLVAAGKSLKPSGVGFHDIAFLPSGQPQSLSDVSAVGAASKLLIRLHGSFMLAAWIGTASVGILLARYYRTTWVGGSLCGKDYWFAWHRMFMCLTWALTMTAFVLIFVELRAWSNEDNPHAILGTVTSVLCFLQPIGAYFRPHPGTSKRPIFNWVHWLAGNAAHIIGIVTIFFAVRLTKAELPEFVDWILVAYVAFHVLLHIILSVMGCVAEKSSERRITAFPMKDMGGSGRSSAYADRNPDSPYSGFRKFMLGIYIVVVLGLVVALIVITALAPIEQTWDTLKNSVMKQ